MATVQEYMAAVQRLEALGFSADNGRRVLELPAGTTEAEAQAMANSLSLRSQDQYQYQGDVFTDIKDGKRCIMVPFGSEAHIDTVELEIFNTKLLEARTRIALEFWNAKQEAGFDTLTPEQIQNFDLDGNGRVTAYDLQQIGITDPTAAQNLLFDSNVINEQGVVLNEEERRIQVAKKVHFDKDNDGIAQYKETQTLTAAEIAKLDIDGDGRVTKADLATIHANDAAKSWHEHLVISGVITADGTVLSDEQRTARAEAKEVAITANSSPEAAQNLKEGEVKKLDIDGNSKVTVDDLAVVYGYDTAREKQQVLVDNGLITKDGTVRTDAERDTEKADAKLVSDTQKKFDDLLKERGNKLASKAPGETELQVRMQDLIKDPLTPEELKQPMRDQLQQQTVQSMQLEQLLKTRKDLMALEDSGKTTVKQWDKDGGEKKNGENVDVDIKGVLAKTEERINNLTSVGGEMAIAAQNKQRESEQLNALLKQRKEAIIAGKDIGTINESIGKLQIVDGGAAIANQDKELGEVAAKGVSTLFASLQQKATDALASAAKEAETKAMVDAKDEAVREAMAASVEHIESLKTHTPTRLEAQETGLRARGFGASNDTPTPTEVRQQRPLEEVEAPTDWHYVNLRGDIANTVKKLDTDEVEAKKAPEGVKKELKEKVEAFDKVAGFSDGDKAQFNDLLKDLKGVSWITGGAANVLAQSVPNAAGKSTEREI